MPADTSEDSRLSISNRGAVEIAFGHAARHTMLLEAIDSGVLPRHNAPVMAVGKVAAEHLKASATTVSRSTDQSGASVKAASCSCVPGVDKYGFTPTFRL